MGRSELTIGEAFDELLAAARNGYPRGFDLLYSQFAPAVTALARVRGSSEPEEIANDVFAAAFSRLDTFSGDSQAFKAWLFTITRRRVVDEHRRAASRPATVHDDFVGSDVFGGDAEQDALREFGTQWVQRMFAGLPPDQREVLFLRLACGLTLETVGEITGKSVGAVKQLQRRALIRLRKRISREGITL